MLPEGDQLLLELPPNPVGAGKWEFCRHFAPLKGLKHKQQLVTKRSCREIILPSRGAS